MPLSKVAVIASEKVADGLMMMVASHRLTSLGIAVDTFHDRLQELQDWFGDHRFVFRPKKEAMEEVFSGYDLIILQYDTTPYIQEALEELRRIQKMPIAIFYPCYSKYTHPPLTSLDRVFNKSLSMVDNISLAIASLLEFSDHSKNNGLLPPSHLLHRRYRKRVAIRPSPTIYKKYEKIAQNVEKAGYNPFLIETEDLSFGASIIFESGYFIGPDSDLCHLASNLQIPTLIVSGNKKPLILRKPGWLRSSFITPPRWLPRAFEHFIFTPRVISAFNAMVAKDFESA
ncbi:MAG: hypothetical protein JSR76_04730 [Verrucomicrobia bacterium]|nr:hypothetical protein [Verrucomicrobiota bacterium]